MKIKLMTIAAMLVALTGCNSFKVQQTNRFIDEDGNLISVQYGLLAKPHKTQFVSPVNGKTLDMESKLAVKVTLPDGGRFTGYQCMNMLRTGTMYKSSNEKWLFHANGTSCSVYL
ncbi:MAG: hypothetical protein J6V38_04995, partial [Kiritimatiellae bacterium]|nr:hypothetical protein [Kiritimatiellia bacterium]